jgi:hypothetical protein
MKEQEDDMKALLEEARQEAASLRAANARLLQRLDNLEQAEWSDAVNEARRARGRFEEARQSFRSLERAKDREIHNIVGRKIARGIARGPFHALVALANVYAMRGEINKDAGSEADGTEGNKEQGRREID